jgi:pimeloyl-ACP methyl ester carboxylesterase
LSVSPQTSPLHDERWKQPGLAPSSRPIPTVATWYRPQPAGIPASQGWSTWRRSYPSATSTPSSILAAHRSELLDAIRITETGVDVDPAKARHLFFGDADDETGAEFVARLRSMPLNAGDMDYEGEPAWKSLPCTYLVATRDRAIPPDAQRSMATRADEVIEWPTDHSPFTSHPRRMAELLHSYIP